MESRLIPTLICCAVVAVLFALMWLGWKNRQRRQNGIAPLAEVPARYDRLEKRVGIPGIYVVTTTMGDWLNRVAVHTLGVKSKADVLVYDDALIIAREGAQDIYIPASDLIAVRTESGITGKFVEKNGLVVVSWSHENTLLDTGIRTQYGEHTSELVEQISAIAPHAERSLPSSL